MKVAPLPSNESERLALIKRLDILDTVEEQSFDDLTYLAAQVCQVPIALVCIVDQHRQWFKSHYGLDKRESSRDYAFCAHTILTEDGMFVPDASVDERFIDNPFVTESPNIRFYAGIPLDLEGGLHIGTLCIIDSKPKKLSENELKQLKVIAQQATAQLSLRLRIKELEKLKQLQSEFVGMVTHELRTPTTSIVGGLTLLESKGVNTFSDDHKKLLSSLCKSAQRLNFIINDILQLTKVNLGQFKIEKTSSNINKCIENVVDGLKGYVDKFKMKITLELDPGIPSFLFDWERIGQVLSNFISNAIKVSPKGGEVKVSSVYKGDVVRVSVQDFGVGIPDDRKQDVFTGFAQITKSVHEDCEGTGLGLLIAKEIIEQHGGNIGFESKKGEGSTFYFELIASST